MFDWPRLLILSSGLILLARITAPIVFTSLTFFIAALSPLVATLFLGVWLETRYRKMDGQKIDPRYGSRTCPSCGKPASREDIICRNCYQDLGLNCPACGEILYIKRRECPACGETLQAGTRSPQKTTRRKLNQKELPKGVKPPMVKIGG